MKNIGIFLIFILLIGLASSLPRIQQPSYVYGGVDTIVSGSVSAVQQMKINFSNYASAYRTITVYIDVVPNQDNVSLYCLTSANGTSFDSAAYDYFWATQYTSSTTVGTTQSTFGSTDSYVNFGGGFCDSTYAHHTGVFWILNPSVSTVYPIVRGSIFEMVQVPHTNGVAVLQMSLARRSTAAIEGMAFAFKNNSTTTITGKYTVVGNR